MGGDGAKNWFFYRRKLESQFLGLSRDDLHPALSRGEGRMPMLPSRKRKNWTIINRFFDYFIGKCLECLWRSRLHYLFFDNRRLPFNRLGVQLHIDRFRFPYRQFL